MKILIVEDEEKLLKSLKKGLEENGYNVDTAINGVEGKKLILTNKYKVIISDIKMPQKTGLQMLKSIREKSINTPVLMLTALSLVEEKLEVYEAGADDYLTKPFDFRELLVRVRALIKRNPVIIKNSYEILSYGGIELNPETKEVTRDGIQIFLTSKEFELLNYFLLNSEKTISKQELLSKIWDLDFQTSTNVLEVYINFLRNKLDKDFDEKLIHTLSRVGYIFKSENMIHENKG